MKILHVIETLAPRFGGPVSVLRSLAAAQVKASHRVVIATTNANYPAGKLDRDQCAELAIRGVEIRFCDTTFHLLKFSWEFNRSICDMIRWADIVHVHGLYRYPPTYAAWQAKRLGAPLVLTPHGNLDPFMHARSARSLFLKRIYEHFFDLPNLNSATAIHYTSEEERNLAKFLKLKAASFVVPNGLDWSEYERMPDRGAFRARLGLRQDIPMVLFLGRINFKKGLDLLVQAFASTIKLMPHSKLVIAGPDNEGYGRVVRDLVDKLGVTAQVVFVDMLIGREILEAFVDADLFVLASYSENFGMTVIESLSSGTPVVISDRVNIHREVAASNAGIVVPCDSEEISAAITALLQQEDKRRLMGSLGREWARQNFDWINIESRLSCEYQNVIQRHLSRSTLPQESK